MIKTIKSVNGLYHLQVGNWDIQVQLDGSKTAALQVFDKQLEAMFNYGNLPVVYRNKAYRTQIKNSSLLLEIQGGKMNKQEVVDELPDVVKFDPEPK
jgi:hypothetical protein